MGFLSGLGKAVGGLAKGVSKVAGIVSKVTSFLQKPLDVVMEPVKKAVGGLLDKLPFGLGKIVSPFVDKFFDSALGFLAGGPLGGLGILAKAMPTISKLGDLATKIGGAADQVADLLAPEAKENVTNIVAEAHAGLIA
jgi:hypothetical protein